MSLSLLNLVVRTTFVRVAIVINLLQTPGGGGAKVLIISNILKPRQFSCWELIKKDMELFKINQGNSPLRLYILVLYGETFIAFHGVQGTLFKKN